VSATGPRGVLDRTLTPDDLDAYLRLRETTFGYPGRSEEVIAAFTARLPRTHGAFVAGELVTTVTHHAYRIYVAGSSVAAGGFGAISTAPEHRRSGHVARLMRAALTAGREAGQGWNLLYPFDAAFYARFGWASVPTGVLLDLPPERLPDGTPRGLQRVDGPAAQGLAGAHERAAATRTFADTRTVGPWDAWEELDGAPGERVLRYASDDALVALRLHEVDGEPRMEVIDLGWADAVGRDAVWGMLAAFRGHVARVRIHVPWDDPVALDRVRGHAVTGHAGLMARITDVALAVAPLRAVADDDTPLDLPPLVLRVVDPFAAWNDGVWRLEPGPAGTSVTPSRAIPDATVDVRGLALLVSGAGAPSDARRAGWSDGSGRALAAVAALSGGRRPYRSLVDAF